DNRDVHVRSLRQLQMCILDSSKYKTHSNFDSDAHSHSYFDTLRYPYADPNSTAGTHTYTRVATYARAAPSSDARSDSGRAYPSVSSRDHG
ncbi:hypothetical protein, partial [Synechococcus sp. W70.1]|uniref:hypothetical protein n=1 Tax=Synechococcus sp. W70.1 TaxID=2964534 RepID=UPI0039C1ED8A